MIAIAYPSFMVLLLFFRSVVVVVVGLSVYQGEYTAYRLERGEGRGDCEVCGNK